MRSLYGLERGVVQFEAFVDVVTVYRSHLLALDPRADMKTTDVTALDNLVGVAYEKHALLVLVRGYIMPYSCICSCIYCVDLSVCGYSTTAFVC